MMMMMMISDDASSIYLLRLAKNKNPFSNVSIKTLPKKDKGSDRRRGVFVAREEYGCGMYSTNNGIIIIKEIKFSVCYTTKTIDHYLFAFATLSNSSFFLMAYEFELPLAAFTNSSAKHSAIVLTFLNAASRAPVVNK